MLLLTRKGGESIQIHTPAYYAVLREELLEESSSHL